ncbi:MAG TPA: AAA family ATPase [Vicinamibacteria bacterium]
MGTHLPRPAIERRLLRSLESPNSVVLVGPRGSGKTFLLERLRESIGDSRPTALIQMEPIAASPEILCERFLEIAGPLLDAGGYRSNAFPRWLGALAKGTPGCLLLLDDATEIRTLSYFPGVERPLESLFETLAKKHAPQAILTSRFPAWIASCFDELSNATRSRFEVVTLPAVSPDELEAMGVSESGPLVTATGGLPVHLSPLIERMRTGESLPGALAREIATNGHLEAECRATLGQLLHRARGYGACKAVLHVLAAEEGLRLSEIARRLDRTPGSTRDYLRWLEEVDLIVVRDKRFFFVDPVLRLWLRLYGRGELPSRDDIESEVGRHLNGQAPAFEAESGPKSTKSAIDETTTPEQPIQPMQEDEFVPLPPPSDELIEFD